MDPILHNPLARACGAGEAEVHRTACPVWLTEPTTQGTIQCVDCPKKTNSTRNGRCLVCDHWHRQSFGVVATGGA